MIYHLRLLAQEPEHGRIVAAFGDVESCQSVVAGDVLAGAQPHQRENFTEALLWLCYKYYRCSKLGRHSCSPNLEDLHGLSLNAAGMHRRYYSWSSQRLKKTAELLVFGHAGQNWLVFPTARGRFFDWENFGMIQALREPLERGWPQLTCLD